MPSYLLTYQGGMPRTAREARASLKRWEAWFNRLGRSVAQRGTPVKDSKMVGSSGLRRGNSRISGYSVLRAVDSFTAARLAKTCPIYREGGRLSISEVIRLPRRG